MDAMTAPDHRRHFVTAGLVGNNGAQLTQIVSQDFGRLSQLNRQGRVENVGRGKSLMDPARGRTDRSGDVFEKRDDVVVGALLDLEDLRNGKARSFSNFGRVVFRNLAKI